MRNLVLGLVIVLGLVTMACGSSGDTPTATSAAGTTATTGGAATASATATPSPTAATPTTPTASPSGSASSGDATKVVFATGFTPNVQFAPFYLAADRGYYAAEGLDVEIKHGASPDLLSQVGSGGVDFGVTTGDQLALARINGVPVKYVMATFQKYPVGAVALADSGVSLKTPAALKGKNIGVSQANGTTYLGLLALLHQAGLTVDDVHVTIIGFTEVEALLQKRVEAAMTFLTNEPAQVQALGVPVQSLAVSDFVKMVGSGVVTSDQMLAQHPEVVQKFVNATLKGLADAQADPDAAFEAALKRMPELAPDKQPIQRQVLEHTLTFMRQPEGHPFGWTDPEAWASTQDVLKAVGMTDKTIDPAEFFTNEFVDKAGS